jgi:hypothetical protein
MHTPPVDYTAGEVSECLSLLEQTLMFEKSPGLSLALRRGIAVIRAVEKLKRGTRWLSELSGT